ncbi:MAG: RHS repeat-associated core domain-containing protein, partial [Terriglobia bacterium]
GNRVARRDSSGNVYYYFPDHLGTTKTLTTSAGVVCYDADFTPFGYERAYTTTCSQNYKFTGLERDSETGLDHTLNRKYDSSLGRWLTPDRHRGDPLNPQSWNRYVYVLDNPVNFTDPYGLVNWSKVGWGLAEVGLAVLTSAAAGPGAPALIILGTGSLAGQGAWNVIGGIFESPAAGQIANMYGTFGNPVGGLVAGITGDLQAADGAACVYDLATFGLSGSDPETFGTPLQNTVYIATGVNAVVNAAQWDYDSASPIYVATIPTVITVTATPDPVVSTSPTSVTVTATPEPVETATDTINSTLEDQDGGGAGGGVVGGGGNGEPCDNGATPEECSESNQP